MVRVSEDLDVLRPQCSQRRCIQAGFDRSEGGAGLGGVGAGDLNGSLAYGASSAVRSTGDHGFVSRLRGQPA